MTKVLIITGKLQNYRVPIFNRIVERGGVELTVAHSSKKMDDGTFLFNEVVIQEKKIGPFTYHRNNLKKISEEFDIIIPTFYLQKISFMSLLFGKRKYKLAYWGIGVKASQNSSFDQPTILNKLRYLIAKKSDAMIFYTDYAKEKYVSKGIEKKKLFVMNNTVYVADKLICNNFRNSIVFIGTLNKSKKIFELLNAYKLVYSKIKDTPILNIVGGGIEYNNVKEWIFDNNLAHKIKLYGPIYDTAKKAEILNDAICAISPSQAGLSVLDCMGHGVPFITHKNAITGGERFNINSKNDILFNDFSELELILLDICKNREKYIELGYCARNYYKNNRTIDHMVDGFFQTINYLKNT